MSVVFQYKQFYTSGAALYCINLLILHFVFLEM